MKKKPNTKHWNRGDANRPRFRKTLGRPRTSVTDLPSAASLRSAYRKDLADLLSVCHHLGWVSTCLSKCVDTALKEKPTEATTTAALYGGDALATIASLRERVETLIKERSPRPDAGAPHAVLAKARAASRRSRARNRKGGAL